jgi:large subunit ribosomal protein L10
MLKQDKERLVAELTERLRGAQTLIVTDYRGLSITQIEGLRTELLKHGARFSVVKNTLTRLAAQAAGADALLALLEGPTAIAFLESDGDPVAVAKALSTVARETRVLEIRGGVLEGSAITEGDVQNLAKLPPTEALRGQVVGALAGPVTTIVGLFAAPLRDLVGVLDARIRQLEEHGRSTEATAAEEPVAEEPVAEATATDGTESEAPPEDAGNAEGPQTPTADEAAGAAAEIEEISPEPAQQQNEEEE